MTLTRREKTMMMAAAALAAGWGLYGFLIRPAWDRTDTLERVIAEKENLLCELTAKTGECRLRQRQFQAFRDRIAAQPPDFRLLPYLESLTARLGLQVQSLEQNEMPLHDNYRESVVELKIADLRESQLTQFLSNLQAAPALVQVKSLDIRKTAQDLLELTVQIGHITIASDSPQTN